MLFIFKVSAAWRWSLFQGLCHSQSGAL